MWILPVLAYVLFVVLTRRLLPSRNRREVCLAASVAWGALLVLIAEGLGAFHLLTPLAITLTWAFACAALFALSRRYGDWSKPALRIPRVNEPLTIVMLGCAVVVVVVSGFIAVLATPNNHDSMTYHLSRVMHWAQNQSLAFYPTHILRQLHQSPAGEVILLHLYLLNGDDRSFNLVQWISMLGSVVAVSAIARRLGTSARGQLLAACLCALLPMGILQASTTQNAYVVTFWLLVLALEIVIFGTQPSAPGALIIGASLGLAIGTKGTAYVFAPPLVLLALVQASFWRALNPRLALTTAMLVVGAVLLLNAGQFLRNQALYGSPIGPGKEEDGGYLARYANDEISGQIIASNLIRNLALQIGTGFQGIDAVSRDALERSHEMLGIALNDERSTWPGTRGQIDGGSREGSPLDEDSAGNLVHLALIAISFVVVLASSRHRSSRLLNAYMLALVCGVVLFATLLRWQPWHARLHLTWFAMAMPLVGLALSRFPSVLIGVVVVLTTLWSWPALVASRDHSLSGNNSILRLPWYEQMFINAPTASAQYRSAAQLATGAGCADVGIHLNIDDSEYPLWRMIQPPDGARRIEHVGVVNPSASLSRPGGPFQPCIVLSRRAFPGDAVMLDGRELTVDQRLGPIAILRPTGEPFPIDIALEPQAPRQSAAGETQQFRASVTNTGLRVWPAAGTGAVQLSVVLSRLDSPRRFQPVETRIALPRDLTPGDSWIAETELIAPDETGTYALRYGLVRGAEGIRPRVQQVDVTVNRPSRNQPQRGR